MKLKHLILTGLLAGAAYKLYQNRDQVAAKIADTQDLISEGQDSLNRVQTQAQTLKEQTADLKQAQDSLAYKLRVFKEESQPHLTAIQDILANYKTGTTKTGKYIL